MDLVGPILDIVKLIWTSSAKCVKYHRGLDEKMKMLEEKLEELNGLKSVIEAHTGPEDHRRQTAKQEVVSWLKNVQEFNDDKHLQQKFEKVKFLSRACLGRKVAKKIVEVEQYYEKGKSISDSLMDESAVVKIEVKIEEIVKMDKMDEIWSRTFRTTASLHFVLSQIIKDRRR